MPFPPSLPLELQARCFRATNGELGVRHEDVGRFLDACDRDGIAVLGCELWLADHAWVAPTRIEYAPGSWSGGIPSRDGRAPMVWQADCDGDAARLAIADLPLGWVDPEVRAYLRFNFALDPAHKARCMN